MLTWLCALAIAQTAPAEEVVAEEIVVLGDRFARWDRTRWHAQSQVRFPKLFELVGITNDRARISHLDLAIVLDCERTWTRSELRTEVVCRIEDVGVRVVSPDPHARDITAALDAALTGADLQIIANANGRVDRVELEGMSQRNDREKAFMDQARQLVRRPLAGFHLQLPSGSVMNHNQWVETDSTLFEVPTIRSDAALRRGFMPPGQEQAKGLTARDATFGQSMSGHKIVHQLHRYAGRLLVQSEGEGTILLDPELGDPGGDLDVVQSAAHTYLKTTMHGVSIFQPETGILTERVWSVEGDLTASSSGATGSSGGDFFHVGALRQLTRTEAATVGPSGVVSPPRTSIDGIAPWTPLP